MNETVKTIDDIKSIEVLQLSPPILVQGQKSLRLLSLDVLRAVAVLLVLGRHMMSPPLEWAEGQRLIFKAWQRGGWVGVDLFFVLSGFLVSRLLFSEFQKYGQISAGHFYLRRGLKIYPAFYVLLAVSLMAKALLNAPPSLKSTLAEFFFVQNYFPGIWNHTWSLAVEEHFYLMLPLLLKCFVKFGNKPEPFRGLPKLILLVVVAILGGRLVSAYLWGYGHYSLQFQTHSRLDGLLIGVLIAWLYTFRHAWLCAAFSQVRHYLILTGSLLLSIAFVVSLDSSPLIYTLGFSVFALASKCRNSDWRFDE
ncbi:MAG: acyltransferase [Acidobacteria bacterium]|nr:acyltransferase [Acidobacteriota bacterium]